MTTFVYYLRDPRNDEIRYVGITSWPERRLEMHCAEKKLTHKCRWVQKLIRQGLRPKMDVQMSFPSEERARVAEQLLIDRLSEAGVRLTNCPGRMTKSQREVRNTLSRMIRRIGRGKEGIGKEDVV
jgi:predicted GIY-YIG superfamily endonuclease